MGKNSKSVSALRFVARRRRRRFTAASIRSSLIFQYFFPERDVTAAIAMAVALWMAVTIIIAVDGIFEEKREWLLCLN